MKTFFYTIFPKNRGGTYARVSRITQGENRGHVAHAIGNAVYGMSGSPSPDVSDKIVRRYLVDAGVITEGESIYLDAI